MRPIRRICFVMPFHIDEGRGGGAEVQAWLLARELSRRGYDVHYVAQSVLGKAGRSERNEGVTFHWLPYRAHLPWLGAARWYRALARVDPDLVIQRMSSETTGVIGLYARRNRRSFTWICTEDSTPRRWLFLRRQVEANRKRAPGALKSLGFLADAAVRDLLRQFGMRRLTHAFTQNEAQQRRLQREFGIDSSRLPSGHEPPAHVADAEARRREGVVLWVATLGDRKRPDLLGGIARRVVDAPLRFVMIGGHADREVRERAVADLPPNVEWLGKLPFAETLPWFARAAVLVNTSAPDGEGFPNTYIQAWLRGVPVVSLGVDPDGVIREHGLGRVAAGVEDAATALLDLLADAAAYARLSAHVAAFARERYTVARVADRFLESVGADRYPALTT